MVRLFLVLTVCCLYGALAQPLEPEEQPAAPAMPPVQEAAAGMLPEMEPGLVLPVEPEQSINGGSSESSEEEEEPVLARCKRPLCRMYCPYGYRSDAGGCPLCSCLENICTANTCEDGKFCKPIKCEAESCTELKTECVVLAPDCPNVKCVATCESGYVTDNHGCQTCECLEDEEPKELPPMIAVDPFDIPFDPVEATETEEGSLADMPCPMPMCSDECPFGLKVNEYGCITCECREKPTSCEDMTCDEGFECYMRQSKPCDECEAHPVCTVPSLCANTNNMRTLVAETRKRQAGPGVRPMCRADGTFSPTQCHPETSECWCVDDRGSEIEGTRSDGKRECAENSTSTLHMDFVLLHNFNDDDLIIMIKSRDIHIVIQEHLGRWLSMNKNSIVVIAVIPDGNSITVQTIIMSDGITDLPSAANHLGNKIHEGKCNIDYRGKTLTPKSNSVKVHHQYAKPALPATGGLQEWRSYCSTLKPKLIAGGVCAILFTAFAIAFLVCYCKKRRSATAQFAHKRFENMENFKKNLIHSRDWEQPELIVAEKENKNVQLISQEPIA